MFWILANSCFGVQGDKPNLDFFWFQRFNETATVRMVLVAGVAVFGFTIVSNLPIALILLWVFLSLGFDTVAMATIFAKTKQMAHGSFTAFSLVRSMGFITFLIGKHLLAVLAFDSYIFVGASSFTNISTVITSKILISTI